MTDLRQRLKSSLRCWGLARAEIAHRLSAADQYQQPGRADQARRLRTEAAVLEAHVQEA